MFWYLENPNYNETTRHSKTAQARFYARILS
jgi:hypothetical protein